MGDRGITRMETLEKGGHTDDDSDSFDSGSSSQGGGQGVGSKASKAIQSMNSSVTGSGGKRGANELAGTGKSRLQVQIERSLSEDPSVLDLSKLQLQSLASLQKQMPLGLSADIQKVTVSNNYLDSIDALNSLQRLKVIVANDNYIRAANLQLPRLQELDLRNNYLEKVPILSQMPQLKVLNLAANSISELKLQCKSANYSNLMKLVLKNNKLKFTNMEVINFVKKLKDFKALKVLSLEYNPFMTEAHIYAKIVRGLPQNLELFNNQRRIYVQGTVAKKADAAEDQNDLLLGQGQQSQGGAASLDDGGEEEVKTSHATTMAMPTLEVLLYNLEAANSHPNRALFFLKQLYADTDQIKHAQQVQSPSLFVQAFTKSKDTYTIKESIETFMQHAQLLVDSHFELRNIILSILSKLTVIRCHDFGVKCFYTLRDLMVAGKELEQQVLEQLNTNVIKEISTQASNEVSVSILIGLRDLVERQQSHQTMLMAQLFDNFFPRWLAEIKLRMLRARNVVVAVNQRGHTTATQSNQQDEDSSEQQTDAILALLTASLRDDEMNVAKMYATGLHDTVAEIFLRTSPASKSRYLHLLECMNQIAKLSTPAATSYVDKLIHREIMQEIKLTFYSYKKSQDLAPADNKDNLAQVVKIYRVFSAQIELIGSLLNAEPQQRAVLVDEPLVTELLQVLTHSSTDPILLTAICYLAEKVLKCDLVRSDPELLADKINKMQSCENLLGYLGLVKFKDLLKATQKYNNQEDQVVQQHTTAAEGASLEYLNDPIIHRLFIQIIKLVQFFCKELAMLVILQKEAAHQGSQVRFDERTRKLKSIFEQVCARLNAAERETALFKCLEIPNDDVRLNVVNCLYYVPLEQIEAEEIDQLLKLMSPQNIGAGKTELVLAVIFNILSNLISDNNNPKTAETTTLFKTKFSYTAISLAISIMTKNQKRQVDDAEEEKEKYTLNLAILNFLKHVSREPKTRDQLENKADVLKQMLFAEQAYTFDPKFALIPIEVETTQMGMDYEALRQALQQSHESIEPYNYVSFRVLHQMANLLQREKPKGTYEPIAIEGDFNETIFAKQAENLEMKKRYEQKYWRFEGHVGGQDGADFSDAQMEKEQKQHHKVFTKKAGVKGILHFLTAQRNSVENWLRQNYDPAISHAGSKEKHPVFGRGLKYKIVKFLAKESRKLQANPDASALISHSSLAQSKGPRSGDRKRSKSRHNTSRHGRGGPRVANDSGEVRDGEQEMLVCFQEEELGSGYLISDTDLYLQSRRTTVSGQGKDQVSSVGGSGGISQASCVMGIRNPELRSLCIAAFLRCLYASIDSAPNGDYHDMAIGNLKDDLIFTQITQLCASTGWLAANIGSKYLQVMRYIVRVRATKRLEDKANLVKYEVLVIVIRRILGLLKDRIKNENQNQELDENDTNLLCHLAVICDQIVSQCTLFDFRMRTDRDYNRAESPSERQLRYKSIDFLMAKLFPLDQVQILIDVILQEILNSYARLKGKDSGSQGKDEHEEEMKAMGNRTLEHTKKFLTKYLTYCETNKYQVLHYLMHKDIFVGKRIRYSLLEEILEGTNQLQVSRHHIKLLSSKDGRTAAKYQDRADQDASFLPTQARSSSKPHFHTLAFRRKHELQEWLERMGPRENEPSLVARKRHLFEEVSKDCYLGERILYAQPMNVHLAYLSQPVYGNASIPASQSAPVKAGYTVLSVVFTNLGVYLIDDRDQSFRQDPASMKAYAARETSASHHSPLMLRPERLERFSYSEIEQVSDSYRLGQRLVLSVRKRREASHSATDEPEEEQKGRPTPQTPTPTPAFQDKVFGHQGSLTADRGQPTREHLQSMQRIQVTLVVPNFVDSVTIREIIDEGVLQAQSEVEDEIPFSMDRDFILDFAIHSKLNQVRANARGQQRLGKSSKNSAQGGHQADKKATCAFCHKPRELAPSGEVKICQGPTLCSYMMVYAYRMRSAKTFTLACMSKQRGGVARLLSTESRLHEQNLQEGYKGKARDESDSDQSSDGDHQGSLSSGAEFGILIISVHEIFFVAEKPEAFHQAEQMLSGSSTFDRRSDQSLARLLEGESSDLTAGTRQGPSHTDLITLSGGRKQKHGQHEESKGGKEREDFRIEMRNLKGLQHHNLRVPVLELNYKESGQSLGSSGLGGTQAPGKSSGAGGSGPGGTKTVWFSMMSDYNLQETLIQLKVHKRLDARARSMGSVFDDE